MYKKGVAAAGLPLCAMKREKRTEIAPVKVYLTEKEHRKLASLSRLTGYSKSSYMKSLLNGAIPKPLPSGELIDFIYELNKIGVNINQIAKVANATGNINSQDYKEEYKALQKVLNEIREVFLKPEPYGNHKNMGDKE